MTKLSEMHLHAFEPAALPTIEPQRVPIVPDSADLAAMVRHLLEMRPGSDAEALQVLRRSFAGASLTQRVQACAAWRA
jgi:hypothetical protein